MQMFKATVLSMMMGFGAVGLGAGQVLAQDAGALPQAEAAVLTQEQIDALIAACAAGTCGDAMQAFLAASGLTGAALDELIASVSTALVQAAAANPALAAQVASGLQVAASNASPALATSLAAVVTAVASGNAASVDLTAVASAAAPAPTPAPAPAVGADGSPS
jgi:hypothetical protein